MSWTYLWLLTLIVTGCLLVPVSGMAMLLTLPDSTHPDSIPAMLHRIRSAVLWVLLGLASLHGTHWLLRLVEVGYQTAVDWGWVVAVVVAGLLLVPAAITTIAVRNRPDPILTVSLGMVLMLSLVQVPYWLVFGFWASIDLLATLTRVASYP